MAGDEQLSAEAQRVSERTSQELARQNSSWSTAVKWRDGKPFVAIVTGGSARLDMAFLTAGQTIELELSVPFTATDITIANVSAGVSIGLIVLDLPGAANMGSLVLHNCQGTVVLRSFPNLLKLEAAESSCAVVVGEGAAVTPLDTMDSCVVELRGGTLALTKPVSRVRVNGSGRFRLGEKSGDLLGAAMAALSSIGELEVVADCELEVHAERLNIDKIVGPNGEGRPALTISGHTKALKSRKAGGKSAFSLLGPEATVHVSEVRNVTLALTERATKIEGLKKASNVVVRGHFTMEFRPAAVGDRIVFEDEKSPVVLAAGKGAVLTNLSGTVVLGHVAHASLSGASDPLMVSEFQEADDSGKDPATGLVLIGASVPRGLAGRRALAQMGELYHFSPDVRAIPGRDQTLLARVSKRRSERYAGRAANPTLVEDAELVREMARLSREKGAPGSVVTQVSWCSYRLRALKATGIVERTALAAYRLIGYGERPMPALITWVLLSFLLAGPVLLVGGLHYDPTLHGSGRLGLEAARLALGPAAGITRAGTLTTADVAEVTARVLTSVPLVTGLLALRNYVKGDAT